MGMTILCSPCICMFPCAEWSSFFPFWGTRFIPHLGHFPGLSDITSGCIGQVYIFCASSCWCASEVWCSGVLPVAWCWPLSFWGTRFIPHLGHFPGLSETTSGCIGQVYIFCAASCWCGAGVECSGVLMLAGSFGTALVFGITGFLTSVTVFVFAAVISGFLPVVFLTTVAFLGAGADLAAVFFSVRVFFTRVIPQMGQLPGADFTTCGCIGQVYTVLVLCE